MSRRVQNYQVIHSERFHNFLISPKFLFEDKLKFVYMENNSIVEKIISLKKIGPYLKELKLYKYDSDVDHYYYKGWAFEIPESVIFSM